ncbi:ATP-binding protein [Aliamphritea ceti]|uniref:ATP-binding protein n=1 Tax=Aliamphritea ceti TaxID=1524258 RepID=UPI0021C40769|nr:ATP-binding protein [Aliamphritea ceti]
MMNDPTFLGEVLSVSGSSILIQLTPQVRSGLLIIEGRNHRIGQVGSFVRIPQGYNDLYGVIAETSESAVNDTKGIDDERRIIKVELVGESVGDQFERGISQFPSINDEAHLVTENDLKKIYGDQSNGQVVIGKLSSSDSINVSVDLNSLVNRHSALLGSTGSGKSTSVSSLLRSIVTDYSDEITKPSSRIVLFDIHGEYASALSDIATVYSVSPRKGEEKLFIPFWCVSPEKLIDFLCGQNENIKNKFMDRMVHEKKEFAKNNDLEIDIETITPYTPLPFRLNKIWYDLYHEDNVNWEEKERETPSYIDEGDFTKLIPPTFKPPSTGANPPHKGGPQHMKKQLDLMKSRLLDGQYSFFLSPGAWKPSNTNKVDKDLSVLIKEWIGGVNPITILDLSGMPSSRLDLLLGSLLDIMFEAAVWGRNLIEGMKERPLLLVMEEAHRYLSNDSNGLSKDMVRRIAKEGRKFGVGSMLVSQRPSEIDETILSQCGTLFALRINNATDRSRVKSAMSDGLSGIVDTLPILRTGEAIVTGEAARLPMRFRFKVPKDGRYPDSRDPEVSDKWSQAYSEMDYSKLVKAWRQQKAISSTDDEN